MIAHRLNNTWQKKCFQRAHVVGNKNTRESHDEIGQLADGINVFLETLQRIMGRIVIDSREMGEIVTSVVDRKSTRLNSSHQD